MRIAHRYWIISLGALLLHPGFAFSQDAVDTDPQTARTIEQVEESYEKSFDDNPYVETGNSEAKTSPAAKVTVKKVKKAQKEAKKAQSKKKKSLAKKAKAAKVKGAKAAPAPKQADVTPTSKPALQAPASAVAKTSEATTPASTVSQPTETAKTDAQAEKADAAKPKLIEAELPAAAPADLELKESSIDKHGNKRLGILALAALALGSSAMLLLRRRRYASVDETGDAETVSHVSRFDEPRVTSGF